MEEQNIINNVSDNNMIKKVLIVFVISIILVPVAYYFWYIFLYNNVDARRLRLQEQVNILNTDMFKWKEYIGKDILVSFNSVKARQAYGDGAYMPNHIMKDENNRLPSVYVGFPVIISGNTDIGRSVVDYFGIVGGEKIGPIKGKLISIKPHVQDYRSNGNIDDLNEVYAEVEIEAY